MLRSQSLLIATLLLLGPAHAETAFTEGAYEVEVSLELPFVQDTNTRMVTKRCMTPDPSGTHGFAVLSENNPLGKCPASDPALSGDTLSFVVRCPGTNAAIGHAVYQLAPESFRGRIEMKMGGKNMTMTEVQTGRRIGSCDDLKGH